MQYSNNYLCHHGIKGQRWGIRRFQNHDGTRTPLGKNRRRELEGYLRIGQISKGKSFVYHEGNRKVSEMKLAGGVAEELAVQAISYTVAFIVMYGMYKLDERSVRKAKMKEFEEYDRTKEIKNFSDVPQLSKKMRAKDSVKVTNPGYPSEGRTMNCTFCTTAMALREKGYDVRARAIKNNGFYTDDLFKKAFNSNEIKMSSRSKPNDVIRTLASNGDGAYGNLTVNWIMGGSHSLFWKNENSKTHIYDGQSGKEITESSLSTNRFMNSVNLRNIRYSRFDNCEPTQYALAMVERNTGSMAE